MILRATKKNFGFDELNKKLLVGAPQKSEVPLYRVSHRKGIDKKIKNLLTVSIHSFWIYMDLVYL